MKWKIYFKKTSPLIMRASLESTEQVHRQRELVFSLKVAGQGSRLQTQAEANAIVLRKKKSSFPEKPDFAFKSLVNR